MLVLFFISLVTGCSDPEVKLTSSGSVNIYSTLKPQFWWNLPKKEYYYTIRVAADENFSKIYTKKTVFNEDSLRLDEPLPLGESFVQLGISQSPDEEIVWVDTSPFKIRISPPKCKEKKLNVYYLDKAEVEWSGSTDAVNYEIQVASDNQFTSSSLLYTEKTTKNFFNIAMKNPHQDSLYCRVRAVLPGKQFTEWSETVEISQMFFGMAALNIPETAENIMVLLGSSGEMQFSQKFPGRQTIEAYYTKTYLGISEDYKSFVIHQFKDYGQLDWQMEIPLSAELEPFIESSTLQDFYRLDDGSWVLALSARDRIFLARINKEGEYLNTRLITPPDLQEALVAQDSANKDVVRSFNINDVLFVIGSGEVILAGNIALKTYNSKALFLSLSSMDFNIQSFSIYHDDEKDWTYNSIRVAEPAGINLLLYGHEMERGGGAPPLEYSIIKHVYGENRKLAEEKTQEEKVSVVPEDMKALHWDWNTLVVYRDNMLYIPDGFNSSESSIPVSLCKAYGGEIHHNGIIKDRYLYGGFVSSSGNMAWITSLSLSGNPKRPHLYNGSVFSDQPRDFPFVILDNLDVADFYGVWDNQMMSKYSISGSEIKVYGGYSESTGTISKIGTGLFKCEFSGGTEIWEILEYVDEERMTIKITLENDELEYWSTLFRVGGRRSTDSEGP